VSALNLFYEEPDPDRFLPFDRYPRRVLRRFLRGPQRVGGQMRVFLNLCAGLERIGVEYRVNDYRYARAHCDEVVGIIGKPWVLDKYPWRNPIVFGAAVFSHPTDDPTLFERLPVRRLLVPGEWMRRMCEPYFGNRVHAWPVGIDTDTWKPSPDAAKDVDVLFYDKVRWDHAQYQTTLLDPIANTLKRRGLRVETLRYGFYEEDDFLRLLGRSRSMLFLCEHETQGIAYQQALSAGVPILAWDRGGFWQDPSYYPDRVRFEPVSSVPYWDARCGTTFRDEQEFREVFDQFWSDVSRHAFDPRGYILEHLTLEKSARAYVAHLTAGPAERVVHVNGTRAQTA
jgi:glycosyltransferase involved in cell wall biosynthesis